MKCSNCGTENREGARFCHACGETMGGQEPLPVLPEIEAAEVQAVESIPASEEPPSQAEMAPPEQASDGVLPVEADLEIPSEETRPESEAAGSPAPLEAHEPDAGPSEALPVEPPSEAPPLLAAAQAAISEEEEALPEIDALLRFGAKSPRP